MLHSSVVARSPTGDSALRTQDSGLSLNRTYSVAEIRVEPRRKIGAWPWVVGLLVLALAIWGLAELLGEDDGDDVVEQMETRTGR